MKKKLLYLFIALLSLISVFAFYANADAEADDGPLIAQNEKVCFVRGDVNFDGQVSSADARLILRFAVLLQTPSEKELLYANLDSSDDLTASDARIALRIAVKLQDGAPHISAQELIIENATCYSTGSTASECAFCGCLFDSGIIPKKQHTGAGWDIIEASTCTKTGLKEMHCVYCDKLMQTEVVPLSSHIYGDLIYIDKPDCTRMRRAYRECKNCSDTENLILRPTAHSYVLSETTAPTCTGYGIAEMVCSVCGDVMPDTEELILPFGHSVPGAWTVVRYPTETEDGLRTKTCTRCGEELHREVIPKTASDDEA